MDNRFKSLIFLFIICLVFVNAGTAFARDFIIREQGNPSNVLFKVQGDTGNIGVGTSDPGYKLDISGGSWNSGSSAVINGGFLGGYAGQKVYARDQLWSAVSAKYPGRDLSIIIKYWDGMTDDLDTFCQNEINSGWHFGAAAKGKYFSQPFDGNNFYSYASVVVTQSDFDNHKSTGDQWHIACTNEGNNGNNVITGGNIGVGTTTPQQGISVIGGGYFSQPVIVGTPTSNSHAATKNYVDSATVGDTGWVDDGSVVRLTSSTDSVGIGTDSPGSKLEVNGDIKYSPGEFYISTYQSTNDPYLNTVRDMIIKADSDDSQSGESLDLQSGAEGLVTIVDTGNVGINESNPTTALHVQADGNQLQLQDESASGEFYFEADYSTGNDRFAIKNNSNDEVVTIKDNGSVGIGTTSPGSKLEVNGTIDADAYSGGSYSGTINAGNVSSGEFGSNTGGGNYSFPGNVGIGTTGSYSTLDVIGDEVRIASDRYSDTSDNPHLKLSRGKIGVMNEDTGAVQGGLDTLGYSYDVLSDYSLDTLAQYDVIFADYGNNMANYAETKLDGIIAYVENGGNLFLSGDDMSANTAAETDWNTLLGSTNVAGGTSSNTHLINIATYPNGMPTNLDGLAANDGNSDDEAFTCGSCEILDEDSAVAVSTKWDGNYVLSWGDSVDSTDANMRTLFDGFIAMSRHSVVGGGRSSLLLSGRRNYNGATSEVMIQGDTSIKGQLTNNGNVGIGTTDPGYKLEVSGDGSFTQPVIVGTPTSDSHATTKSYVDSAVGGTGGIDSGGSTGDTLYWNGSNWAASSNLYHDGTDVGIGTASPGEKLEVEGSSGSTYMIIQDTRSNSGDIAGLRLSSSGGTGYNKGLIGWRETGGNAVGDIFFANNNTADSSDASYSDTRMIIKSNGNVGIGTTAPSGLLDVGGSSGSNVDGVNDVLVADDLEVDGTVYAGAFSGSLSGTVSAGNVSSGAFGSNTGGGFYSFPSRLGIGTASPDTALTVANDSWISAKNSAGDGAINMFKVNSSDEIEVGGTLNIGTIELAEDSGVVGLVNMPVSATPAAGTQESYSFSLDSDTVMTVYGEADGSGGVQNTGVGIGTTAPSGALDVDGDVYLSSVGSNIYFEGSANSNLDMGGNDITGVGKFTVSTIDPLYDIDGVKYSTYAASVAGGVYEEATGVFKLEKGEGGVYEKEIDFSDLDKGRKLWLFGQVTDFGREWNNLSVVLTPEMSGGFWDVGYEKDFEEGRLVIYSRRSLGNGSKPEMVEVSYRLTAPRFDYEDWPIKAKDQSEETNLIINN